ncbi:MAG TPA: 3-oxoacyl-ACP reductase family protein [Myxococcota bacterium]|nr:3-oxoacyl-ACP reductase family protein [Myxococcota bacterium]
MRGLTGRVILVTGGARGIGRAIVERLVAEGARVAIADIQGAKEAAAEVGHGAYGVRVDVADSVSVRGGVGEVIAHFGKVEGLVNNAGWDKVEPFVKAAEETWDKVLAINLRGPIAVTRAVLDGMIERRAGWIVSISSDAGRLGSSGEVVYSAAKAGVIGFSKALAREVAKQGIHVNVVCPGPTNTPLLAQVGADNPKLVEALARAVPFGRIGEPADLAGAVAFLLSDDAAFITGQTLSVSGGMSMV